jgi:hypothetical protein
MVLLMLGYLNLVDNEISEGIDVVYGQNNK